MLRNPIKLWSIEWTLHLFKKWAFHVPFCLFSSFLKQTNITIFTTNQYVNLSNQYTVIGFEPMKL